MKDSKLEAIHRAVQEYRSTRANRRTPMPDSIKVKVIELIGQYSIPYLSKQLVIPDGLIYKWKNSIKPKVKKRQKHAARHFVELPIDLSREHEPDQADASFVEFQRTDGVKMRIQMTFHRDHLNRLLENFLGGISSC